MARGKGKNRKRSLDLSSVGEKSASAPSSGDEKKRRNRRKAKIALTEPEPTLNPAADFIDLSKSTPDIDYVDLSKSSPRSEAMDLCNESESDAKTAPAESSKQAMERTPDAKGKSREPSFGIDTNPGPAPDYHPSAFTPMKSLLSSFVQNDDDDDAEDGELVETGAKELQIGKGRNKKPILIDIDVEPHPETEAKLDGERAEKDKADAEEEHAGDKSGLLLPEHVRLMESDEEGDPIEDSFVGPQDGVHVVDDSNAKAVSRYFNELDEDEAAFLAAADQRQVCRRCKKTGHKEAQCPHIICTTCGAMDEHDRRDCPWGIVCFGCGKRGHRKQDCPDPASRTARIRGCNRCGLRDHMENTCPLIWRVYVYRTPSERDCSLEERDAAEGWTKEAVGGNPETKWCYNCAMDGHLGDDCGKRRGSLARPVLQSAFSEVIANRGPFASFPRRQGKHHRFDDLPEETSYSKFGGANPGRRGREKQQQRHRYADRRSGTDSDDWFSRRRDRSRSPDRRPWDRGGRGRDDRRDDRRDSRGGPIKFGRMSLPGSSSGKDGKGGLLQQALHNGQKRRRQPSPRPMRDWDSDSNSSGGGLRIRGRGSDRERDMEREWRASGAGGGNVADWGDDYDRMMRDRRDGRDLRDDRPRNGPFRSGGGRGGRGGGGGGRGGGGGGQRYRGGY